MIETRCFGSFTPPKESLVDFPEGLPGFPEEKAFLLIEDAHSKPVVFLQSAKTPGICFITLPASAVQEGYQPVLTGAADVAMPRDPAELLCLVILTVVEGEDPTANLLAPVIIDIQQRRGVQVVQAGTGYSHRHPLFAPLPAAPSSPPC